MHLNRILSGLHLGNKLFHNSSCDTFLSICNTTRKEVKFKYNKLSLPKSFKYQTLILYVSFLKPGTFHICKTENYRKKNIQTYAEKKKSKMDRVELALISGNRIKILFGST